MFPEQVEDSFCISPVGPRIETEGDLPPRPIAAIDTKWNRTGVRSARTQRHGRPSGEWPGEQQGAPRDMTNGTPVAR